MDFKDELIHSHQEQAELQAEREGFMDSDKSDFQNTMELFYDVDSQDLTAEQEDYMLEQALEDVRLERDKQKQPTTFEMTIQRLKKEKELKGWTSLEYFERIEQEAKIELDEYKSELELAYGID